MSIPKHLLVISVSVLIVFLFSCKKENKEDLDFEASLCSLDTISYQLHISVVLNNNCMPCHSASQHQGDVILDNYNDVAPLANSGDLLGVTRRDPGYTPMPTNTGKISDCSIAAIEKWANQGAPNN